MKGEMGMLLTGGWAQGNSFKRRLRGQRTSSSARRRRTTASAAFDLNADAFIFWKSKSADFDAGQKLLAEIVMSKERRRCTRRSRARFRCAPTSTWRARASPTASANSAARLEGCIAKDRVVLSLAHNMAQPNRITAAMIDVLTEFVHDSAIPAARRAEEAGRGGRERAVGSVVR